jgi:hypothetical protein
MLASPMPLTSARRAAGAAITSANEPNVAISVLASALTSRRSFEMTEPHYFAIGLRVVPCPHFSTGTSGWALK